MSNVPGSAASSRRREFGLLAAVLAAACLPMLPSLGFDLVWDDRSAVSAILDADGIGDWLAVWTSPFDILLVPGEEGAGYYRPIIVTTLMLDRALFGEWLPGYHITNIAWYAATCAFLWLFLRELGGSLQAATLGALLYAVHPVHAESVCLITGRVDLVAGGFFVAALWLAARGPKPREGGAEPDWYFAPAVVLALGMFSKEVALLGAPVVALVSWQRSRDVDFASLVRACVPVAVAGMIAIGARLSVSGLSLGREDATAATSMSVEVATGFLAFGHYMQWLLTGTGLAARHEMPLFTEFNLATGVGILAFLGIVTALGIGLMTRARWSAAPALIVATLVPLSWSPLLSSIGVAERLLYVPSVALAVVIALLPLRTALIVAVLGIGIFGATLPGRVAVWSDQTTLFESMLRDSGETAYLHHVLAVEYSRQSKQELADSHLASAHELEPGNTTGLEAIVDMLLANSRFAEALPHARNLTVLKPGASRSWFLLGAIQHTLGDAGASVDAYSRAAELEPTRGAVQFGLATAFEARRQPGDLKKALERLKRAEELDAALTGLPAFRAHLERAMNQGPKP